MGAHVQQRSAGRTHPDACTRAADRPPPAAAGLRARALTLNVGYRDGCAARVGRQVWRLHAVRRREQQVGRQLLPCAREAKRGRRAVPLAGAAGRGVCKPDRDGRVRPVDRARPLVRRRQLRARVCLAHALHTRLLPLPAAAALLGRKRVVRHLEHAVARRPDVAVAARHAPLRGGCRERRRALCRHHDLRLRGDGHWERAALDPAAVGARGRRR